jgi:hypothetical protein
MAHEKKDSADTGVVGLFASAVTFRSLNVTVKAR